VVRPEDFGVLGQETFLLLLNNICESLFFGELGGTLVNLQLALGLVDDQLILPEALDFALVLYLAHASLLRIHLLETLILGELLHQPLFEFVLHAALLSSALSLEAHLEVLGLLQLLDIALLQLTSGQFLGAGGLFALLEVEFVAEVFLEFLFGSALRLFLFELLEDGVAGLLSGVLGGLDLVEALLLLIGVLADHFVFVLLHFLLTALEGPLLVDGEDHVSLGLLHLLGGDAGHFSVLVDHAQDNVVDLHLLLLVLLEGLAFQFLGNLDLVLDSRLVLSKLFEFVSVAFALHQVLKLLLAEVVFVNVSVVFL